MGDQEREHNSDVAVRAHRERATTNLDKIVKLVRCRLEERGLDVSLFFLIPRSGDAIISYGSIADPPDELWAEINDLVCGVVKELVGIEHLRSQAVVCAATEGDVNSRANPNQEPRP